jgi:putative pyruvate formate lyase activating enzyme
MLPMILKALGKSREQGLEIPFVYNCSGYQKLEILKELEGIIDIYLVDMRYDDNDIARTYSGCKNYTETNRAAVKEMYRQVGNLKLSDNEIAQSGIIVRHLVLPDNLSGSAGIFGFLANEVSADIYVSLMSQYFPAYKAVDDGKIGRRITLKEFDTAKEAFFDAGLENGFIQEMRYESAY